MRVESGIVPLFFFTSAPKIGVWDFQKKTSASRPASVASPAPDFEALAEKLLFSETGKAQLQSMLQKILMDMPKPAAPSVVITYQASQAYQTGGASPTPATPANTGSNTPGGTTQPGGGTAQPGGGTSQPGTTTPPGGHVGSGGSCGAVSQPPPVPVPVPTPGKKGKGHAYGLLKKA